MKAASRPSGSSLPGEPSLNASRRSSPCSSSLAAENETDFDFAVRKMSILCDD